MSKKIWIALTALAAATGVNAQTIAPNTLLSASRPQQIANYISQLGYRAQMEKDSVGDPMIKTAMSGYNIQLLFYGCEDGKDCTSVQFVTSVTTRNKISWNDINQLNENKRYMHLALDSDQDPVMRYDLPTGRAGISAEAFKLAFDAYEQQVGDLRNLINSQN